MPVKISRPLNLIFPIERDDGTIYIHSAPLAYEVYERYFLVIGKTFDAIYGEKLIRTATRTAALMLRSEAEQLGVWDGEDGVQSGLMAEIRRLSSVVTLGPTGWTAMPLDSAMARGAMAPLEVKDAEGAIVFFTCLSCLHRGKSLAAHLQAMSWWGAETTLLSVTDWATSLPISTPAENTGAEVQPSSEAPKEPMTASPGVVTTGGLLVPS